jgi:hypothetical protein
MKWIILLSLLIASTQISYGEVIMCLGTDPKISTVNDEVLKLLKISQIEHAQKNMGDFCRRNLMLRFLNSKKIAPPNCESLDMKDLEALVDKATDPDDTAWILALKSTKAARLASADSRVFFENRNLFGSNEIEIRSDHELFKMREQLKKIFDQKSIVSDEIFDAKITIFCGRENFFSVLECRKNLKFIQEQSRPVSAYKLLTPLAWEAVYGSNKLNEGLHKLSVRLHEQVIQRKTNEDQNIFDDLVEAFKSSGLKSEEAIDGALNVLALISNAGQNTESRVASVDKSSQKSKDLTYISAVISPLDYIKQANQQPLYSYPKNVKTNCDSAKYYHFWMNAYLARFLVKEKNVKVKDAINASYLSQKGYQLSREIGYTGVSGNKSQSSSSILKAAPYGPIHQVIRMDLAYAAAGAEFGAKSVKAVTSDQIDVDQKIVNLLKQSGHVAESSELNDLEKIQAWEKIFAPEAALKK